MADNRKGGRAVVAEHAERGADDLAEPEQPGLFGAPLDPGGDGPTAAERRRGRPKGSRNLSTRKLRELILSRHTHPLMVLAETYTDSVDDLAERLGCDRIEAFRLQMDAAKTVAEYVEPKLQRLQVTDGEGQALPTMTIVMGAGGAQLAGEDLPAGAKLLNSNDVIDADSADLEPADLEREAQPTDDEGKAENGDVNH